MTRTDVVIPARNEAGTIEAIVSAFLECWNCGTVYVADDASTDHTGRAALQAGAMVIAGPGIGKGQAMTAGLRHVRTPRVVFCDGDLTGFTAEHAAILLDPVYPGEIIGKPDSAWSHSLAGQRSLPVEIVNCLPLFGWLAETQINIAVAKAGLPARRYNFNGVMSKPRAGVLRGIDIGRDALKFATTGNRH